MVGDLCVLMTLEAILVGPIVPGGFSCAKQVLDKRPDALQQLAHQVAGWAMG